MSIEDEVTVFHLSCGEPSRQQSLGMLRAQDCKFCIEEIAGVTPLDRALQEMVDRCRTPYYAQVDADMLLKPHAIRHLWQIIQGDPKIAFVVGWLWGDAEEMPIQGVKMYRHEVLARYPYSRTSMSAEVEQQHRIQADGFRVVSDPISASGMECCLGVHFSMQTPEMAFRRWRRLVQKYRAKPWMGWVAAYPARLREKWLAAQKNMILEAAYLGAVAGMTAPLDELEVDYSAPDHDYRRVAAHLGEYATGPRELTLYITDRCNFRCTFDGVPCKRETGSAPGDGVPHNGDMTFDLVERVLDRWPSIRGVCIAGFGEPLLYPDIQWMIQRMANRGLFCGLITNGSLLLSRLDEIGDELLRCSGHYLSVSLNASTPEEHQEMSHTRTWERTLAGMRAALDAGLYVGASYVCTRGNAERVPEFLRLCSSIGLRFVDLHNVLPHHGSDMLTFRTSVITHTSTDALNALEDARRMPEATIVRSWPKPIDLDQTRNPHRCMSPFASMGIDAAGYVTACRRVEPPQEGHGHVDRPNMWESDLHFSDYRLAVVGDRPPPDGCKTCFGNWHE